MERKTSFTVALVQMNCEKGEIRQNLQTMQDYIAEARSRGADFVCFPEMNLTGYIDPVKQPHAVISMDHEAVKQVIRYSALHSICVIAGFVEHNPGGKPYITQFVANDGELLGCYRKKTIKEGEEQWFDPGAHLPVFSARGLRFGISICADIDDPDIFRAYAEKGAAFIFECAAPGLYGEQETRNWSSGFNWWRDKCRAQLGAYAAEQAVYIGTATQAGRTVDEDFPGGGYLFDPQGTCAAESGDWGAGVLYVQVRI
ncbi:carbon-nitrogen hydrolase family protein [Paenibacillus humicola]|uniref:carbon-nitrogen hydrolase family protein n=1 Tax=Paenibacillus humicola TaxID=3110540 RepID=UPI00237ACA92|nr:carbon-nitrogen hydrolase family protein [Paenibacillus humicola]